MLCPGRGAGSSQGGGAGTQTGDRSWSGTWRGRGHQGAWSSGCYKRAGSEGGEE